MYSDKIINNNEKEQYSEIKCMISLLKCIDDSVGHQNVFNGASSMGLLNIRP